MDEVVIDLKKYKKIYVKKTILYLFVYPIIVGIVLFVLGLIVDSLGFNGEALVMLSILPFGSLFFNIIITWWIFYFNRKDMYKSTKFVIEENSILFVHLKSREIDGGTFYYHNIQSVSSYSITNEKIIINGSITKRQVEEKHPDNQYKERIIDKISVPNVFANVKLLEEALKNKQQNKENLINKEEKKANQSQDSVLLDTSNLLLSDERHEAVVSSVIGVVGVALWIFLGVKILIIFVIFSIILFFVLIKCNYTPMSPQIKYSCPFCKKKLTSGIDNKGKDEHNTKGYIVADCPKCKKHFKLILTEKVLKYF